MFTFILVKVLPLLLPLLTLPGLFWFHSVAVLTCVIFAFFTMPETRGKTLSELSQTYGGKVGKTQSGSSYPLKFRKKRACGICGVKTGKDTERKFLLAE